MGDYKNNFFNDSFELILEQETDQKEFLSYLKEVIENKNDFYAKILEIIGLCAKVRLGKNEPLYMDKFLDADIDEQEIET